MTAADIQFESAMEAKHARRMRAELKTDARLTRLESRAEAMIGELCRDGRTVHYISPIGGKYREGGRCDLMAFLIRNKYVR